MKVPSYLFSYFVVALQINFTTIFFLSVFISNTVTPVDFESKLNAIGIETKQASPVHFVSTITRVITPTPKTESSRSTRECSSSGTNLTSSSFNAELHTPRPYGRSFSPSSSVSSVKSAAGLDKSCATPVSFTVLPYQSPIDGGARSRTSSSETRLVCKPPLPSPLTRTSGSKLQSVAATANLPASNPGSPAPVATSATQLTRQNASDSQLPEAANAITITANSLESVASARKRASSNFAAEQLDTTSSWSSFNSTDVYGAACQEPLGRSGDGTPQPTKKSRSLRSSLQSSVSGLLDS